MTIEYRLNQEGGTARDELYAAEGSDPLAGADNYTALAPDGWRDFVECGRDTVFFDTGNVQGDCERLTPYSAVNKD